MTQPVQKSSSDRMEFIGPNPKLLKILGDLSGAIRSLAAEKERSKEGDKALLLLVEAVAPTMDHFFQPVTYQGGIEIRNVLADMTKTDAREKEKR